MPRIVNRRELRKFAWLMAGAFLVPGCVALYRGRYHSASALFIVSALFLAFGVAYPAGLRPVYVMWMKFAKALAWLNTRILLSVLFYGVLTPISLIFRLVRRDALDLQIDRARKSYWHRRERLKPAKDGYQHLY